MLHVGMLHHLGVLVTLLLAFKQQTLAENCSMFLFFDAAIILLHFISIIVITYSRLGFFLRMEFLPS